MSDSHDGGGRRRRSKRGLAGYWPWIAVGVVALLLVANLVMSLLGGAGDGGVSSGGSGPGFLGAFISDERLVHIGLWAALLPAAVAGAFGVYWASEAFARSERPISLWLRRAFIVSLTSWIALIVVIMDVDAFNRTSVAIAAAALSSVQLIPFAIAARTASEGRFGGRSPRDEGGSGGRRRRSSSGRSSGRAEENQS